MPAGPASTSVASVVEASTRPSVSAIAVLISVPPISIPIEYISRPQLALTHDSRQGVGRPPWAAGRRPRRPRLHVPPRLTERARPENMRTGAPLPPFGKDP